MIISCIFLDECYGPLRFLMFILGYSPCSFKIDIPPGSDTWIPKRVFPGGHLQGEERASTVWKPLKNRDIFWGGKLEVRDGWEDGVKHIYIICVIWLEKEMFLKDWLDCL